MQELYPDVRVKVLYQRDYLHLLVKYGLEPPSQLVAEGLEGEAPRPFDLRRPAPHDTRPSRPDVALRHSPLDARHPRSGRLACPFGGWEMPISTPACQEQPRLSHRARSCSTCRTSARCTCAGPAPSPRSSGRSPTTSTASRPAARSTPTCSTPTTAHVVDDLIVWWTAPGDFIVMPNASNTAPLVTALLDAATVHGGGECTVVDVTADRVVLAVQGPEANAAGLATVHPTTRRWAGSGSPARRRRRAGLDRGHRLHR